MGSHQSTPTKKKTMSSKPESSLLFSKFCGTIQENNYHDNIFTHKSNSNFPLQCGVEAMETIVHLWFINCLSVAKWKKLNSKLRNQMIRDFLNTLYCTSHSFDELFLLMFTNSKSRSFITGHYDRLLPQSNELHNIVEDMLSYSSSQGLKYCTHIRGEKCFESVVDFPLKTFSLCPCTRRPLYVAMYLSRPEVVKLLLKYGAKISYEDVCKCLKDPRHPLQNVMEVLKVPNENKTKNLIKSYEIRKERNILSLKLIQVDMNHTNSLWLSICDTLKNLTGIEELNNIPSLKHISRTRIRFIMRGSPFFCYPHVWQLMRLPQTLADYMNLEDCCDLDRK